MRGYEQLQALIEGARALKENPAAQAFMEEIRNRLTSEQEAHEDPKKSAVERAEHLFAVHNLRELLRWPDEELKRNENALQNLRAPK